MLTGGPPAAQWLYSLDKLFDCPVSPFPHLREEPLPHDGA